jgi:DNA invertase Pin-like site-specific DNA recombinase
VADFRDAICLTAISRPGLKKLLEDAEPGDTVVVWRVDAVDSEREG